MPLLLRLSATGGNRSAVPGRLGVPSSNLGAPTGEGPANAGLSLSSAIVRVDAWSLSGHLVFGHAPETGYSSIPLSHRVPSTLTGT
jgi:hypothetical protein